MGRHHRASGLLGGARLRGLAVAAVVGVGTTLLSGCTPPPVSTVQQTQLTLQNGQSALGFVDCLGDTRVVGGGVVQSGSASGLRLVASGPVGAMNGGLRTLPRDGDVVKTWYGAMRNDSGAPITFRVFALCSETTDATAKVTRISVPPGGGGQGVAVCPPGERALGGGVYPVQEIGQTIVQGSGPLDSTGTTAQTNDGDVATQWYGSVLNNETQYQLGFEIVALCATNPAATIKATSFTLGNGVASEQIARCPTNKHAFGGGVVDSGPADGIAVRASGPLDDSGVTLQTDNGDFPTQWDASVLNQSGTTRLFKVFAVCA